MALTIESQILGQPLNGYKYVYEPFKVAFTEDDLLATKLFLDVDIYNFNGAQDGSNLVESLEEFGLFDIIEGVPLAIDICEMIAQKLRADVFKNSTVEDIVQNNVDGWGQVVANYSFKITARTDVSSGSTFYVYPILGGRGYDGFNVLVDENQPLTEFQLGGIDISERWLNYPYFTQNLSAINLSGDSSPTINSTIATNGKEPKGGYVIWKSVYGGWMSWGFDISVKTKTGSYSGDLASGVFNSTKTVGGNPYIKPNYTKVETAHSVNLKSFDVENDELKAISGIAYSPAVYYMETPNSRLELMRVSTVSAPLSSNTDGDDFSLTLSSISKTTIKSR